MIAGGVNRVRAAVQPAALVALAHDDAVVVVDAEVGADQLQQVGNDLRVIDQIDQRLAPEAALVFFPVLHRGGVALGFLVRDRVQRRQLGRAQHARHHEEALQVEQEALFVVHGGTIEPAAAGVNAAAGGGAIGYHAPRRPRK